MLFIRTKHNMQILGGNPFYQASKRHLTRSLPCLTLKTTNKSAKFEIIKAFFTLRMSTWKDFYQNAQC